MEECEHLKGRPRDLCMGVGHAGRPNPTQKHCDEYRAKMGLPPIVVQNPAVVTNVAGAVQRVSDIGDRLAAIFTERVAAIPCGRCKNTLYRLNAMTREQVLSQRESIISDIEANAQLAGNKWFVKWSLVLDQWATGGAIARHVIGMWLDEVCAAEGVSEG